MKTKFFTLLLLAVIMQTAAIAQPVIKHQRTIGGNDLDYFSCMDLTKDGGLIAGGLSASNISYEKTENSRGFADYWIVKLDRMGHIEWDKTIGGSSSDELQAIQQTRDGGYILGGYSYSNISGEKTENSRGSRDYWVVKLDSLRNIQWDKTIGGIGVDDLTSIQQTDNGEYILGGQSYSGISGEKTEDNRGVSDYWVIKLDSLGNILWDKTIGGNSLDLLRDLQLTSDGGCILAGYSESGISGEKTENSRGLFGDYWIVKMNGSGNIEWDKTIGGSNSDGATSLIQLSDGGYIVGGHSGSDISGEKTENSRGGVDYWIVRLNSMGNIQWDKTIGGLATDYLYSFQQTSDGGYIFGGYSNSNISGEKTENSRGVTDYWVVKTGSNGKIQWDKTIGGSAEDHLLSIKEIEKYRYVLGGYSHSGKTGDKTQLNRGGNNGTNDYWLVELAYRKPGALEVTAQNANNINAVEKNNTKTISIYPNPAKDILHIQTNSEATFTLTNQSGKILLTTQ